jgi:hypothetical protein
MGRTVFELVSKSNGYEDSIGFSYNREDMGKLREEWKKHNADYNAKLKKEFPLFQIDKTRYYIKKHENSELWTCKTKKHA